MKSKKALENIISLSFYKNSTTYKVWCEIIKQDLDRLEKLEKENQELLVNKNVAQGIAIKLKEENDRLKKIIEILKRFVSLTKVRNEETNKWDIPIIYSLGLNKKLTQQEYELLKEVLGND